MAYTLQEGATSVKRDETQDQTGGPIGRLILKGFDLFSDFVYKHHRPGFLVNPLFTEP